MNVQNREIHRDRKQISGCLRVREWDAREAESRRYRVSFGDDGNVHKWIMVMVYDCENIEIYTFHR